MRRQDPDALTSREREVLDLIRRGLTNEEIARRLGITLDGAKYHVSQILSKLGVATREEAAAVALGERRRWWAGWPLWARIAGGATVATAVAGLAVLAWVVMGTDDPAEEVQPIESDLTLGDLYGRVGQAIRRPGYVLHTTMHSQQSDADVEQDPSASATIDYWIDHARDRLRYEFRALRSPSDAGAVEIRVIVADGYYYASNVSGPVERHPVKVETDFCPDTTDALVSALLWCAGRGTAPPEGTLNSRIEMGEFDGQAALVLIVDESYATTLAGGALPPPTGGTVPPTKQATSAETRNTSRTYVFVDTFLPVALDYEIVIDGEHHDSSRVTYEHEFVLTDDVPSDIFDPASIGYTGDS